MVEVEAVAYRFLQHTRARRSDAVDRSWRVWIAAAELSGKIVADACRSDRAGACGRPCAVKRIDAIAHPRSLRRKLGYLPQDFGVNPDVSAQALSPIRKI